MLRPQIVTIARSTLPVIRQKASIAVEHSAHAAPSTLSTVTAQGIMQSLLAAAAGVGTVSGVAAVIDYASAVPIYELNGQRFSQETFGGRFARMLLACDPRLLLTSDESVYHCQRMLKSTHLYDDRALWEAKRTVEATCPDGETIIPRPFRMSGYVPYNGPICVAMVASQSTMPLLFWSWVNQSQNALVNYYNRNASSPMTNETLLKSYGAAVGSALLVAFGLATGIQR